jgi:hypothetical protein
MNVARGGAGVVVLGGRRTRSTDARRYDRDLFRHDVFWKCTRTQGPVALDAEVTSDVGQFRMESGDHSGLVVSQQRSSATISLRATRPFNDCFIFQPLYFALLRYRLRIGRNQ